MGLFFLSHLFLGQNSFSAIVFDQTLVVRRVKSYFSFIKSEIPSQMNTHVDVGFFDPLILVHDRRFSLVQLKMG